MSKYRVKGLERHGRKWRVRRMIDGRRIVHTFEAGSVAEAEALAEELRDEVDLRDAGAWEHEAQAYIAAEQAGGVLSRSTAEARLYRLLKVPGQAGISHPRQATAAVLRAWHARECERVAVGSANRYLRDVRMFLGWLVERRKLVRNPAGDVAERRTEERTRDVFLPATVVGKLLAAARAREDVEIELMLLLTCECGMRRGEVAAAAPEWVDLSLGVMRIPAVDGRFERKGRVGRRRAAVVPMVGDVRGWFERHGVPGPYLLRPEKEWGKHRYRYDFEGRLRRFMKAEGVEGVTIHDLRRSFGSNRVSAGTSIEKIANWMGISPGTAWRHYARFLPADDEIELGSAAWAQARAQGAG